MTSDNIPPPWLVNMQRYGPPPSYSALKIPGLNAPLPSSDCQYGYHVGGWGKPPVDNFGRPLYGGNPFDMPSSLTNGDGVPKEGLVTSDNKTLESKEWGALPIGGDHDNSDEEDESDEEMEESDSEEEEQVEEGEEQEEGNDNSMPPPPPPTTRSEPVDLRKNASDTSQVKELYTVLEEKTTSHGQQQVFGSQVQYAVPGGAESVLSKAESSESQKEKPAEDDEEDLDKNFKF